MVPLAVALWISNGLLLHQLVPHPNHHHHQHAIVYTSDKFLLNYLPWPHMYTAICVILITIQDALKNLPRLSNTQCCNSYATELAMENMTSFCISCVKACVLCVLPLHSLHHVSLPSCSSAGPSATNLIIGSIAGAILMAAIVLGGTGWGFK